MSRVLTEEALLKALVRVGRPISWKPRQLLVTQDGLERVRKMKKSLGLKKALDLMRLPGTRLVCMFTKGSPEGIAHYVIPGGYVEPDVAAKIKAMDDVISGKDGLFPNVDQTWRIISDSVET